MCKRNDSNILGTCRAELTLIMCGHRIKNKVTQVRSEPKCLAEGLLKKTCRTVTEIIFIVIFWSKTSQGINRVSRGNVPDFERIFLKLKYTDLTKNTYIRM